MNMFQQGRALRAGASNTRHSWLLIGRYGLAVLTTAAITAAMLLSTPPVESTNIALLYQLDVLVVAITAGLGPSILAALLSFLAFHFFFVPHYYSFVIATSEDLFRLLTFLIVAISTSSLAARARTAALAARTEAAEAQQRAVELAALYELSQTISAQIDLDRILPTIAETVCQLLQVSACGVLLYDEHGRLYQHTLVGQFNPQQPTLDTPMRRGDHVLGVLRIPSPLPSLGSGARQRQLLDILATQVRLAIERAALVAQMAHLQALAESDQLKSALLLSVSHDLRTPLAVIKGAVSTLLTTDPPQYTETDQALIQTIDGEADHLNQIIGNLLAMSRIEAGALQFKREWEDLAEVIGVVLQRMRQRLDSRPVDVDLAADLPFVSINSALIEQVLTNLIENAIRYTPPGTPVRISVRLQRDTEPAGIAVTIRDYGPGIPDDQIGRIFEKFQRGTATPGTDGGTGLGLAICQGIVEAHGGRIWAANVGDGGAAFTFILPESDHENVVS